MNNRNRDSGATVHHGDGTTTVFAINFAFPNASAVEVVLRDDATKEETVQSPSKDYSVTGGGAKAGSVKMRVPPPSDKAVIIRAKPGGAVVARPAVSPLVIFAAAGAGVVVVGLLLWFLVFAPSETTTPTTSSLMAVTAEDITVGSPNAPITMIEYASLGCPHCAEFQAFILPEIKTNYIDKGLVFYVLRDYPHNPPAMSASLVASCAPRESYLKFVDMLFASQQLWAGGSDVKEGLVTVARRAGMTRERVEQCLADNAKFQAISAARDRAGKELDFNSIPTFFVNGRKRGPSAFPEFDQLFKSILAQLGVQQPAGTAPAPADTPESAPKTEETSPESTDPESDTTPPTP